MLLQNALGITKWDLIVVTILSNFGKNLSMKFG